MMDCQKVQQLLVFLDRKSEDFDAVERDAVLQHLAKCPACQALAESERRADEVMGSAMREVPVPADLQQKVMKRLSAQQPRLPWKRGITAIAAMVLIGLSVGWYLQPLPQVTESDLTNIEFRGFGWEDKKVAQFVADEGMQVELPRTLNYEYLRRVEIVDFKKQRVVRLTFHHDFMDNQTVQNVHAEVLILPHKQFRVASLKTMDNRGANTSIHVIHEGHFTYVIFLQGDLERLQHGLKG